MQWNDGTLTSRTRTMRVLGLFSDLFDMMDALGENDDLKKALHEKQAKGFFNHTVIRQWKKLSDFNQFPLDVADEMPIYFTLSMFSPKRQKKNHS